MLLVPLTAAAELPRLLPFLNLAGHDYDGLALPAGIRDRFPSGGARVLLEPFVFWSTDGLLCILSRTDANRVACRDTVSGKIVERKRPRPVTLPVKSLTIGAAVLTQDGKIGNDTLTKVAKLRCARSPLLDRKEYRYLPGPDGRLAVLVLEEDDVNETCAALGCRVPNPGRGHLESARRGTVLPGTLSGEASPVGEAPLQAVGLGRDRRP